MKQWMRAVETWIPLEIAVACRLLSTVRTLLWLGRVAPAAVNGPILLEIASSAGHWTGAPAICKWTLDLVWELQRGWAPRWHRLHHPYFRQTVRTVLLVSSLLARGSRSAAKTRPRDTLKEWCCR